MNRRQEIAAWIFGLVIALALVATDHDIAALVVLAGLTIMSLRDRQTKTPKDKSAAYSNGAIAEADASSKKSAPWISFSRHDVMEYFRGLRNAAFWAFVIWLTIRIFRPEHANQAAKTAAIFLPVVVVCFGAGAFLSEKVAKGFLIGCLVLAGSLLLVVPDRTVVMHGWFQRTRTGNALLIVLDAIAICFYSSFILGMFFITVGTEKHWRWFSGRFPLLGELVMGAAEQLPLVVLITFFEIARRLAA
jgi:hypothetical protein